MINPVTTRTTTIFARLMIDLKLSNSTPSNHVGTSRSVMQGTNPVDRRSCSQGGLEIGCGPQTGASPTIARFINSFPDMLSANCALVDCAFIVLRRTLTASAGEHFVSVWSGIGVGSFL